METAFWELKFGYKGTTRLVGRACYEPGNGVPAPKISARECVSGKQDEGPHVAEDA